MPDPEGVSPFDCFYERRQITYPGKQGFSSPVYVNAFLKELDENGITYDLQDVNPLELPNTWLCPWPWGCRKI